MGGGECRHLEADQGVLDGRGEVVWRVALDVIRDGIEPYQDGEGRILASTRQR